MSSERPLLQYASSPIRRVALRVQRVSGLFALSSMVGCPLTVATWWWLDRDDSGPYMGMGILLLWLIVSTGFFSLSGLIATVAVRRAN